MDNRFYLYSSIVISILVILAIFYFNHTEVQASEIPLTESEVVETIQQVEITNIDIDIEDDIVKAYLELQKIQEAKEKARKDNNLVLASVATVIAFFLIVALKIGGVLS
ncbi:hypothetical protein [Vallitalea okinawensis]|uniref:hypothetical protein n=1 Tax=Vallitalea okinawensis TaxID=2078660 RepID=UPI000CFCF08E|nr:hypothetical protein [Vallitalea okinawensis]